jgi:translation initiation factor 2 alpha subunit (eIF-2alpha)
MTQPAESKAAASARTLTMRYYEHDLPQLNELVAVKFTSLTDNSAYVQLLEYANIQGLITFSELHRGRITSIAQYASVGKEDVLVVIRLDPVNRYIDLSKRTLKQSDKEAGTAKMQRGRDVLNYMCTIADSCGVSLPEMMEKVAWPLYRRYPEGGALEALKLAVTKPDEVFGPLDLPQPAKKVRAELERLVQMKLKPKVRKYESEVSVTCNTVAGVESIKTVLLAGAAAVNKDAKTKDDMVQVTVKASPHFTLRTQSFDRETAMRALHTAIQVMKETAEGLSVTVEVDKEPCDVSGEPQGAQAARSA